jgi:hypothetical protein|tara:strand:+ start:239 stop:655 length:417 start_codon:yes stop_codon:yes gene_type:complete
MSSIPSNVVNKSLYSRAKTKANKKYGAKTGAYKSMYIVSEYKRMGGKYTGPKKQSGTTRWNKEKWIQVIPFIKSGKKIACGSSNKKGKACRPTRKLKGTPITLKESIKKLGKTKVLQLARAKSKNMNKRVSWRTGKIN